MNALDVSALLAPLSQEQPCGPSLEYDPAYMALEQAAQGTPERQAGQEILPAVPPQWAQVFSQALAVAERTRDVRIAVLLTRAAARVQGLAGYGQGLQLVAGLLQQHWEQVHPQLDADDNNDPTARLLALAPLADLATGLADLRAVNVGPRAAALNVRLLELGFGKEEPHAGESRPEQGAIVLALGELQAQEPHLLAVLRAPYEIAQTIEATVEERCPAQGPDLKPWLNVTRVLSQAAQAVEQARAQSQADSSLEASASGLAASAAGPGGAGPVRTREDVVRTLEQMCQWIEQHEPSNPAPLLIRRAQRLMSKSFLDIVRDLAPDGVSQIELIAGAPQS